MTERQLDDLLELGVVGDNDESPPPMPHIVVDDVNGGGGDAAAAAAAEAPMYIVELRRRRRAHVNELAACTSAAATSPPPSDLERREQARAHRYSVRRFFVDTRDHFLMTHPRASACCWALVRTLVRLTSLVVVAACVYAVWTFAHASTTQTLQTRELASDELSFVRAARFDRVARRPFADTCAHARVRVDERAIRLYMAAAERALTATAEHPCVCAPMFGLDERILSFSSTHAFNASIAAEPCDGAAALEHFYVDESATLKRLYLERTAADFAEVVRARCVRVDYLDAQCQPLRAHLTDQQSFCAQTCAQLFDGSHY